MCFTVNGEVEHVWDLQVHFIHAVNLVGDLCGDSEE